MHFWVDKVIFNIFPWFSNIVEDDLQYLIFPVHENHINCEKKKNTEQNEQKTEIKMFHRAHDVKINFPFIILIFKSAFGTRFMSAKAFEIDKFNIVMFFFHVTQPCVYVYVYSVYPYA